MITALLWEGFELVAGADYVHRFADYKNNYGEKKRDDYGIFAEFKKDFNQDVLLTFGVREQFIDNEEGLPIMTRFFQARGLPGRSMKT
ncbi:hypothetical protein OO006_07320 [Prosthecochloris sp. SCSIO W1101]|uniref:hypothetical protein n=1 Tax=Prosthecochloris sp. SCSIO W1101 TaxID=2992242 RepID=UPI00223DEEEE|nr:hypothetical protein [Prosthecochloris sp. SCSIO W1101]UZJ40186.1 hypothetical protein OO006_07320 [Prosthecochloris sp. SCSIO W1101]